MEKFITGILIYALLPCLHGMAQQLKNFDSSAVIVPYRLEVTDQKTTVLLFPSAIKSVDRGSRGILAEKVKEAENILKVKAERQGLPESNLSVVTGDGKLYSFTVQVDSNPAYQALDLRQQQSQEQAAVRFKEVQLNEADIRNIAVKVAAQKGFLHNHDKTAKMKMSLKGIYVCKNVLFYQLVIKNKSHMDYPVDFSRFYIRDDKRLKRMAIQEQEVRPIWSNADSTGIIPGGSTRTLVFAFKQFTIADHKNLAVELYEQNGDRHLSVPVSGKEILEARTIQ
ncbi:conjugative transposon protein TraN [Mucilaginibacter paludis]|uniref:Conjugative transposon TraN protein n=1 Tax=Mucilaginibacter paludis DSM 18603 TaxID=714943 RepID=H1YDU0_9SPHI|nr:conjugative transposon protein TraN [Mucilaginibacter paludis]EHQ24280.1 conjugative transposon TraN protein [Mucilaginibacter paludis DSM 18603]